jgi:hypothetical protein
MKRYRIQHEPARQETVGEALRALAVFVLIIVSFYALALVAAAYAMSEAVR